MPCGEAAPVGGGVYTGEVARVDAADRVERAVGGGDGGAAAAAGDADAAAGGGADAAAGDAVGMPLGGCVDAAWADPDAA